MSKKGCLAPVLLLLFLTLVGCNAANGADPAGNADNDTHDEILVLPDLAAVELGNSRLKVVATTSIIGDVVAQVGGKHIELTTLMAAGQDPHSFEPAARDLTAVADAQVIFINGWNLEEGLTTDLENIGRQVPVVPVSAGIEPLAFGEDHEEAEDEAAGRDLGEIDPHVWFNIQHVAQWVDNVAQVLGRLDPAHAADYAANAAAYGEELAALAAYTEAQIAQIPPENRLLVTNHDALNYFAQAYGFEIIGTVLPGGSSIAEPSAGALADLIAAMAAAGVCTIFTEFTVSEELAQTVAAELDNCPTVQVLPVYTGALGPAGSGAESYIGMYRANVDTIVQGLR